ncbi:MAG: BON domain-containing protein [Acidobacteriia bacterium]|nr:BON domain-containing protein [Terriglobia bacterium]
MNAKFSLYVTAIALLAILTVGVGCTKAPNDAQLTSDIQTKLASDSGLQGKQLGVKAEGGTVTLTGTVDNDAQRDAAARYAATEPGVKQIINNLQVAPPPPAEAAEAAPPVEETKPSPAPAAKSRRHEPRERRMPSSSSDTTSAPPVAAMAPPAPVAVGPSTPPPPPPPKKVTIPSGTTLAVRLVDTIDSETSQQGQTFHATLDSPLAVDGEVVIPSGYDVEGHLVEVKSAGKFAGQSVVALQLDRISAGGKYYSLQTDQYRRQGSSRGKNTAAKVGAGAGIGAIIGAIAGGGKGAAIGAAAGGGLGGGVQAATKGQQIKLPSETVLNFTLQAPVTVIASNRGPNEGRHRLDPNRSDTNQSDPNRPHLNRPDDTSDSSQPDPNQ